jgi:hypothetical protein
MLQKIPKLTPMVRLRNRTYQELRKSYVTIIGNSKISKIYFFT